MKRKTTFPIALMLFVLLWGAFGFVAGTITGTESSCVSRHASRCNSACGRRYPCGASSDSIGACYRH